VVTIGLIPEVPNPLTTATHAKELKSIPLVKLRTPAFSRAIGRRQESFYIPTGPRTAALS